LVFAALSGYAYYTHFKNIYDEETLVGAIKTDPRVHFANLELGHIVDKGIFSMFFGDDLSALRGDAVRYFAAYEYPRDSVPLSENRKIVGLIDEKLNIVVFGRVMRGDEVFM
jgi:hypothetical protein